MSSAVAKKWESDGKQIVVQCPACQTSFSLASTVLEGVTSPRFHCSRCDHVFALPDFIFDAAAKTAQTRPSTPVPQSLEEPPAPELPPAGSDLLKGGSSDETANHNADTESARTSLFAGEAPTSQTRNDTAVGPSSGTMVFDSPTQEAETSEPYEVTPPAEYLESSYRSSSNEPPTEIRALLSTAEQIVEEQSKAEGNPQEDNQNNLSGLDKLLRSSDELSNSSLSTESPKKSNLLKSVALPSSAAAHYSVSAPREVDLPHSSSSSRPFGGKFSSGGEKKLNPFGAKAHNPTTTADGSTSTSAATAHSQPKTPAQYTQSQLALFAPHELGPQDFSRLNTPLVENGPVLDRASVGKTLASNTTAKDVITPIRRDWAAAAFVAVPLVSTLFALVFFGVYLTTSNPIAKGVVSNLLSGMPMPAPAGLYLKKTQLQILTLDSGEELATLTGTVRNDSAQQFTSVVVEGLAFNAEGHSIGRGLGNVGSPVNRARIKSLSPEAIVDLQSKVSKKFQLKPGEERQFTVALEKVKPSSIKFYSARMFQVN